MSTTEPRRNIKYVKFKGKRAFGVELELGNALPLAKLGEIVKSLESGRDVKVSSHYAQDTNNNHWHVKLDHSCGDKKGEYGCEIASYKASGIKDVNVMSLMVDKVRAAGGNVNDRCSLHVHVEVKDYNYLQVSNLVANWAKMEYYIANMIPKERIDNKYCKFIANDPQIKKFIAGGQMDAANFWHVICPKEFGDKDRRKSLNICNYAAGTGRQTVEFRFPEASLDSMDVRNWVKMFVTIVERCKKEKFPEDLSMFSFDDFLKNCGLCDDKTFFVLSHGLREMKAWLLNRIIKFSASKQLKEKASGYYNKMI